MKSPDDAVEAAAEALHQKGWTCESHEPRDSFHDCEDCAVVTPQAARAVLEAAGPVLEGHYRWQTFGELVDLNTLRDQCGKAASANGWHDSYLALTDAGEDVTDHLVAKTALIGCEVAEAIEELRDGRRYDETYRSEGGKPEGYPSELADVIIRALDLAAMLNIDIDAAVAEKLAYNAGRGHKHGGKTI